MKKQAVNPYLPSYEYVPDGEPYVFGDRLYVFGSHDAFGAEEFCVNDYVCWSAPVSDLSDWRYDGVIYRRTQDPLNPDDVSKLFAPDVCRGPDGRFYLYYQLHTQPVTSVAVADTPEGPYAFYGHVHHPDGSLFGKKPGDVYNFDPGVLMDDDGRIYLYIGFAPDDGLRAVFGMHGSAFDSGNVVELEPDMVTLRGKPVPTIPGPRLAPGTEFAEHAYFEASSIRKIGETYYLVYSSILSHELCYATSRSPLGPWHFGGTIISIGDIGLPGITAETARNFTGNTHGGMVELNGRWFIFYHRQTNRQKCCRQGCAEPILLAPDGSIAQAEMTSCGLNGGPLVGTGTYEARIACNLRGKHGTFAYVRSHHEETGYPYFTQSGTDREDHPDQYIANFCDGSRAGFKYFDFCGASSLTLSLRGAGEGQVLVSVAPEGPVIAALTVHPTEDWQDFRCTMAPLQGVHPLYFTYQGTGAVDFRSFTLE